MVGLRHAPLCPWERASLSPGPPSQGPGPGRSCRELLELRGEGGESGEAGVQRSDTPRPGPLWLGFQRGKGQPGWGVQRPQVWVFDSHRVGVVGATEGSFRSVTRSDPHL